MLILRFDLNVCWMKGLVETVVLMVISVENTKYSLPLAYSEVDFTFFLTRSLKSYGYIWSFGLLTAEKQRWPVQTLAELVI